MGDIIFVKTFSLVQFVYNLIGNTVTSAQTVDEEFLDSYSLRDSVFIVYISCLVCNAISAMRNIFLYSEFKLILSLYYKTRRVSIFPKKRRAPILQAAQGRRSLAAAPGRTDRGLQIIITVLPPGKPRGQFFRIVRRLLRPPTEAGAEKYSCICPGNMLIFH